MNTKKQFRLFLTILSVILITTLSVCAFSFRNMTLDFVHISDTHISANRADTSYKALSSSAFLLKDMVNQINKIKGLDFVMFSGDLVDSASYEISGTTVIITYPTVTSVTKISTNGNGSYVYKAITSLTTPLKDQVTANTTALGGLSLVKLTQAEYDALTTKDNNTLYIISD